MGQRKPITSKKDLEPLENAISKSRFIDPELWGSPSLGTTVCWWNFEP